MITPILLFLGAATLSYPLCVFLRNKLLAHRLMDIPNERSMHAVPVPRGGGLAVIATIMIGLLTFLALDLTQARAVAALLIALSMLLAVSWADDKKSLPPLLRLGVHLAAAFVGCFALDANALLFQGLFPFWLDRLLLILGWGWFMNISNFMDGIDGITSAQTITNALGVGALAALFLASPSLPMALAALLAGGCLGFLKLNWHPASLFLGDAGSVPLGFLIGFILLTLALGGLPFAALVLPLYYLADSGITITKRALRGEKIWQAHRQHFYQRAALGEGSPVPVVLWIACANTGLFGAALISQVSPWLGLTVGVGLTLLLLLKLQSSASKHKP